MEPRRACAVVAALVSAAALTLLATAPPVLAHTHPTASELTAPAVVQVRTDAIVDISLIEHQRRGAHIGLKQARYTVPLLTSSGFAVDPTGSIVTSGRMLDVGFDRAVVYAVNKVFEARYGARAPLPADPYAKARIVDTAPDDLLDPRLQRCYTPNTTDDTGGCLVTVTREVRVLPFAQGQPRQGLAADVVYPKVGRSDVAVLRIGASSMPAARLADRLDGRAYTTLGFERPPADQASQTQLVGHFEVAGEPEIERDEYYARQVAGLRRGLQGGPVVGEQGKVVGFLHVDGGPTVDQSTITLVGPDRIRSVLKAAGVEPGTGPTDTAYEAASHNYLNEHYSAAIPDLRTTLELYPGHALASQFLAISEAKAGTAEDVSGQFVEGEDPGGPSSEGTSRRLLQAGLAGAALLVLALAVLLVRRRSRRLGATGAPEPAPGAVPAPATVVPRPVAGSQAAPSDPRPGPPLPRRPEGPVTVASDGGGTRTSPPTAPGTARERAGTAPGDRGGAWARATASGAGDSTAGAGFLRAVPAPATDAPAAPRDLSCRVCGSSTSAELDYCETCGYQSR